MSKSNSVLNDLARAGLAPRIPLTALCTACFMLLTGCAERVPARAAARAAIPIYVDRQELSWDGKPLGGIVALQVKFRALHSQVAGTQFSAGFTDGIPDQLSDQATQIRLKNCGAAPNTIIDVDKA